MPDLSMLTELAEFYDVDIREIIEVERKSEVMNLEVKDTLTKVADYTDQEKEKTIKEYLGASVFVLVCRLLEYILLAFNFGQEFKFAEEMMLLLPLISIGVLLATCVNTYCTKVEMTKYKRLRRKMVIRLGAVVSVPLLVILVSMLLLVFDGLTSKVEVNTDITKYNQCLLNNLPSRLLSEGIVTEQFTVYKAFGQALIDACACAKVFRYILIKTLPYHNSKVLTCIKITTLLSC